MIQPKKTEYLINPKLLFEIIPGHQDDFLNDLSVLGNKLVFNADDGIHGRELWIFDPAVTVGSLINFVVSKNRGGVGVVNFNIL